MSKSFSESYKEAGVDITAGYESVELMKEHIKRTSVFGTMSDIGGFGGSYQLDLSGIKEPVLVSGTDGVGTKLRIAELLDKHDTIGIDCVAMCVNDVICVGAKPLFFLDYIACGKNKPEKIAEIVKGVAEGCVISQVALVGGETAEHPGMMPEDDYDLAGFTVGVVDKEKALNKENVKPGDIIIALPSSGVHSNGFSLVRKVFDIENADLNKKYECLGDKTLGETLLTPTEIYVVPILKLIEKVEVKSIAHITGGGFYENIPRAIPENMGAVIKEESVKILPIFNLIAEEGNISKHDMFNTFNMGVGMIVIVSPENKDEAIKVLEEEGLKPYEIGFVSEEVEGVEIC